MPGTIVFKPIEANITRNTELIGKMDPYCLFHIGNQKIKSAVCRKGGKHPQWEDSVVIPITDQPTCVVDLKDKDLLRDDKIGTFEVDLREVETQGRLKKWYPLFHKTKPAGEILVEAIFTGDTTANLNPLPATIGVLPTMVEAVPISNTIAGQPMIVDQTVGVSQVVNETYRTTGLIGGGMPITTNIIGGAIPVTTSVIGGGMPITLGSNIPAGNIYGSQGLNSLRGDNVLPVLGGHFPSTHSAVINPGLSSSELYAQEALMRGADPLNVSSINRYNERQSLGSGFGYPGATPLNQFGGLNNPAVNGLEQLNVPINSTSQQIPANNLGRDLVIEEARNL